MDVHPQEFRHPCVDEVIYEHICYLGKEITDGDGYLAQAENVLSVRCEKNKVIIKTDRDSLGSAFLYRFHQRDDGSSYGYKFPILSNEKKENWAARYLQRAGNFIQTPLELRRKVEELSGNYIIRLSSYEIRQMAGADRGDLGEGDAGRGYGWILWDESISAGQKKYFTVSVFKRKWGEERGISVSISDPIYFVTITDGIPGIPLRGDS